MLPAEPRSTIIPESKSDPPELPLFNNNNGSVIFVLVVSMYVVVPCTVKLPLICASPSTFNVVLIFAFSVSRLSLILTKVESLEEIELTTIASFNAAVTPFPATVIVIELPDLNSKLSPAFMLTAPELDELSPNASEPPDTESTYALIDCCVAKAVAELLAKLSSSLIEVTVAPAIVKLVSVLIFPLTCIGELILIADESFAVISSTVMTSSSLKVKVSPLTTEVIELPPLTFNIPSRSKLITDDASSPNVIVLLPEICESTYALIDC